MLDYHDLSHEPQRLVSDYIDDGGKGFTYVVVTYNSLTSNLELVVHDGPLPSNRVINTVSNEFIAAPTATLHIGDDPSRVNAGWVGRIDHIDAGTGWLNHDLMTSTFTPIYSRIRCEKDNWEDCP